MTDRLGFSLSRRRTRWLSPTTQPSPILSQAVVPVGSPQMAPHCRLIGLLYPAVWGRLCFRKRSHPVARQSFPTKAIPKEREWGFMVYGCTGLCRVDGRGVGVGVQGSQPAHLVQPADFLVAFGEGCFRKTLLPVTDDGRSNRICQPWLPKREPVVASLSSPFSCLMTAELPPFSLTSVCCPFVSIVNKFSYIFFFHSKFDTEFSQIPLSLASTWAIF